MGKYPQKPVVIVDDEKLILQSMSAVLRTAGFGNIRTFNDSRDVMPFISSETPSLVLLDLTMPHLSGEQLLPKIKEQCPDLPVIIITGVNELSTAVNCMKNGASDYLVKAIENSKLISAVRSAMELTELREENNLLKKQLLSDSRTVDPAFGKIITEAPSMLAIFEYLSIVSPGSQSILIRGETGTGKDLLAEAVHEASEAEGEFVGLNAAGLDETMFADTLFGHRKGAFSGADSSRPGLIEKAAGGTLFLDEIGDLSQTNQIKLLRLLEKKEYYRLGSDLLHRASCRIITATNADLEDLMGRGLFRKDLYYRLSAHEVKLPPLSERRADIPLLIHHFVPIIAGELNIPCPQIKDDFIRSLCKTELNGNVRELITLLTRAVSLSKGKTLSAGNDTGFSGVLPDGVAQADSLIFPEQLPDLKSWANILVDEALRRTGGNISAAAAELGISQPALSKRLALRSS